MPRCFAVLLAFLIGLLAQPVQGAVRDSEHRLVLPAEPGDIAVNTPRREGTAQRDGAAMGERGAALGEDGFVLLPNDWPPLPSSVSSALVWHAKTVSAGSQWRPRALPRGPPA